MFTYIIKAHGLCKFGETSCLIDRIGGYRTMFGLKHDRAQRAAIDKYEDRVVAKEIKRWKIIKSEDLSNIPFDQL